MHESARNGNGNFSFQTQFLKTSISESVFVLGDPKTDIPWLFNKRKIDNTSEEEIIDKAIMSRLEKTTVLLREFDFDFILQPYNVLFRATSWIDLGRSFCILLHYERAEGVYLTAIDIHKIDRYWFFNEVFLIIGDIKFCKYISRIVRSTRETLT